MFHGEKSEDFLRHYRVETINVQQCKRYMCKIHFVTCENSLCERVECTCILATGEIASPFYRNEISTRRISRDVTPPIQSLFIHGRGVGANLIINVLVRPVGT